MVLFLGGTNMSKIFVEGTLRESFTNRNSAIIGLRTDHLINGRQDNNLQTLKPYADANRLWVRRQNLPDAKIEIFWSSAYSRYVARTDADTTVFNNLDALPIVGALAGMSAFR
jgi:hypothetical protein